MKSYILLYKCWILKIEFFKALRKNNVQFNFSNFPDYLNILKIDHEELLKKNSVGGVEGGAEGSENIIISREISLIKPVKPMILKGIYWRYNNIDLAINILTANGFEKPEIIHLAQSLDIVNLDIIKRAEMLGLKVREISNPSKVSYL